MLASYADVSPTRIIGNPVGAAPRGIHREQTHRGSSYALTFANLAIEAVWVAHSQNLSAAGESRPRCVFGFLSRKRAFRQGTLRIATKPIPGTLEQGGAK